MRNVFFIGVVLIFITLTLRNIISKRLTGLSKAIHILCPLLLAVMVFFWWTFPVWTYPETTGPYEAETVNCIYTDINRPDPYASNSSYRWLNLDIWYPAEYTGYANTCPVIVFSHGSLGMKESNVSLYRELASHGYVVCAVNHTYQCLSTIDSTGKSITMDRRYLQQILGASDASAKSRAELCNLFDEWMQIRMGDINFVLDTLAARAALNDNSDNGVYRLLNPASIGVIGHSLGGAAALGMGRVRADVRAVIALEAPFMYDVMGFQEGAFIFNDEPYPVPVLNVYTDSAWKILDSSPQYAQNQTILEDQSDMTEDIYFKGAGHLTLTDLVLSRPPLCLAFGQELLYDTKEHVRSVNQRCLDFFNCHLRS